MDMGSLRVQEILMFQRGGGCCKVLCVHCRTSHVCDQHKKIAIIDYSRGVEFNEGLRGRGIEPTQFIASMASLVEGTDSESTSRHKVVDLYQEKLSKAE